MTRNDTSNWRLSAAMVIALLIWIFALIFLAACGPVPVSTEGLQGCALPSQPTVQDVVECKLQQAEKIKAASRGGEGS